MDREGLAGGVLGRRATLLAPHVLLDDRVRGPDEGLGRAIIRRKRDGLRTPIPLLKLEDMLHLRASPPVYRLVAITHNEDIPVPLGKDTGEPLLERVGILVLIDVEVTPALLCESADILV